MQHGLTPRHRNRATGSREPRSNRGQLDTDTLGGTSRIDLHESQRMGFVCPRAVVPEFPKNAGSASLRTDEGKTEAETGKNGVEKMTNAKGERKINAEGEACRKCGTPVRKKTHKAGWTPRETQEYYYDWWFVCPRCRTMYIDDSAIQWKRGFATLFAELPD